MNKENIPNRETENKMLSVTKKILLVATASLATFNAFEQSVQAANERKTKLSIERLIELKEDENFDEVATKAREAVLELRKANDQQGKHENLKQIIEKAITPSEMMPGLVVFDYSKLTEKIRQELETDNFFVVMNYYKNGRRVFSQSAELADEMYFAQDVCDFDEMEYSIVNAMELETSEILLESESLLQEGLINNEYTQEQQKQMIDDLQTKIKDLLYKHSNIDLDTVELMRRSDRFIDTPALTGGVLYNSSFACPASSSPCLRT